MKNCMALTGLVLTLLLFAGCGNSVPSFVSTETITRLDLTNNQTGQQGYASKANDNLNDLLNRFHLGDITAANRQSSPEPATAAYTLVASNDTQVLWTVRVLDTPTSQHVDYQDALHPTNSGIYLLKQAISSADLDQFIRQNPRASVPVLLPKV